MSNAESGNAGVVQLQCDALPEMAVQQVSMGTQIVCDVAVLRRGPHFARRHPYLFSTQRSAGCFRLLSFVRMTESTLLDFNLRLALGSPEIGPFQLLRSSTSLDAGLA